MKPCRRRVVLRAARQFIFFGAVGAVGTSGHYLMLVVLIHGLHLRPMLASAAGFGVGAVINYALNYRFTFRSSEQHRWALIKFTTVAVVGALINTAIMWLGTEATDWHYMTWQLIATSVVLVVNFVSTRIWVFRADNQA